MRSFSIKGIFFEDLNQLFETALMGAASDSELSQEEFFKKLNANFEKVLKGFNEAITTTYIEHAKFSLEDFYSSHSINQKRILDANKDSFYFFILYINACDILYKRCCLSMKRRKVSKTLQMGISLYGLILRRAQQIVSALVDGYIDTAMMIWRSMYEYSISMLVIAIEDDDILAEKYFSHSVKGAKKKTTSYAKHYKELKFRPLSKRNGDILKSEIEKLDLKYGKEFLESEYGWADHLFPGKQKASLRALEERVEMSKYRPYYLLCSEHIHSNFNGFRNFMVRNKIILPRILYQDIEKTAFVDPMQFTISILHEATDYILYEFSAANEYEINREFLTRIFQKMQDTFHERKVRPKKKSQ